MYNYGKIVDVLKEELGECGAEAVCDAVGGYLNEGFKKPCLYGSNLDEYILFALFMAMDAEGLNYLKDEFNPLIQAEKKNR